MHNQILNSEDIFLSSIIGGKIANPKVENFKKNFRKELSEDVGHQGT